MRYLVSIAMFFAVALAQIDLAHAVGWGDCIQGLDPQGKIEACTRLLTRKGLSKRQKALAHYSRGNAYLKKHELAKSIADFDVAIRFEPNSADLLHRRGFAYLNLRDLDKAIADYNRLISLDPNDYVAFLNRGTAYRLKGDFARADADYWEARKIRSEAKRASPTNERKTTKTASEIPDELMKCRDDYIRQKLIVDSIPKEKIDQLVEADPKLKEKLDECWPKTYGEAEFYHGMDFVNARSGWVVGWNGRILHTQDAGATWSEQDSSTRKHLLAVDFIDENTGWAVGHGGAVLSTIDGGATWKTGTIANRSGPFFALSCPALGRCWAGGSQSKYIIFGSQLIFNLQDQGKRWVGQNTPAKGTIESIHFVDERTGWAISVKGEIIGTQNAGKNWKLLARYPKDRFWSVHFVDKMHGWIVGEKSRILHTSDGGETWLDQTDYVELPFLITDADARFHVVKFVTQKRGWVAGLKGLLLTTEDGGARWTTQSYGNNSAATYYAMHMHNSRLGWLAGNPGIVATVSGGDNLFPVYGPYLKSLRVIAPAIGGHEKKR